MTNDANATDQADPANQRPSLKHRLEYYVLRSIAAVARALPYRAALALGWCAAAIGFHILRWRRAEAERRIRQVFPDRYDAAAASRIAWLSLRNLAFHTIELLSVRRMNRAWLTKYTNAAEGRDALARHLEGGKGAILAVIHMGNWDAAGIAMEELGIPMLAIAHDQKNPLVNRFINQARSSNDTVVVERNDRKLLQKVTRWLAAGKVVAILIDLRTGANAATFSFLGHRTTLGRGIGLIARLSGAPVLPAVTLRQGWTHHRWSIRAPIYPDPSLDAKTDSIRITAECLAIFDTVIADHPDQYFWYNKKWILLPGAERADRTTPN